MPCLRPRLTRAPFVNCPTKRKNSGKFTNPGPFGAPDFLPSARHVEITQGWTTKLQIVGLTREFGRSERIRTSDPLLPKQVRYQTALRSDRGGGLNASDAIGKRG
jgi:hypothetical protein